MRCDACDEIHDLLEPAFNLPDVIALIPIAERPARVAGAGDLCALRGDGGPDRFFVRTVLPVALVDVAEVFRWGIWVEIAEAASVRIRARWSDPAQADEPPIPGSIANRVPGYPDTIGLAVHVQLSGLTSRPSTHFAADATHPFARECLGGVTIHRAASWLPTRA